MIIAGMAFVALAASPATAGPPWISIEYPPSPYDPTTRDAFLLVHAFHHGTPMNFPVSGTAEGIVSGQRRSVKLGFEKTSRTGTFALKNQWPGQGTWTLMITVSQGEGAGNAVTALVDIGTNGDVASVKVPTERRGGWNVPKVVSVQEVDAALRARVARAVAGT
ncbi:MAG: hypothetical protein ACR2G6_14275 [Gemmatimonadaceae bacterium]